MYPVRSPEDRPISPDYSPRIPSPAYIDTPSQYSPSSGASTPLSDYSPQCRCSPSPHPEEHDNESANVEANDGNQQDESSAVEDAFSDVDDLFKCPVCYLEYSLSVANLKPVMLNCHHTVCDGCANRLHRFSQSSNSTNSIQCPSCRCIMMIRSRNSTLPPNFYIMRLLESRQRRANNNQGNTLSFWCKDCKHVAATSCVQHNVESLPTALENLSKTNVHLSSTLNEILSDKQLSSTIKYNQSKDSNVALIDSISELKKYIMAVYDKFHGLTQIKHKYMTSIDEMHRKLQELCSSPEVYRNAGGSMNNRSQAQLVTDCKNIQANTSKIQDIEKMLAKSQKLNDDIHNKLMSFKTSKAGAYKDRLRMLVKTMEDAFNKCFIEVAEISQQDDSKGPSTSLSNNSIHLEIKVKKRVLSLEDYISGSGRKRMK